MKVLLPFLLLAISASAQTTMPQTTSRRQIAATRTEKPPKIDGVDDEENWSLAQAEAVFTEYLPNNGKPEDPLFRTEVKILYDDAAIYVFAKMADPEPSKIARELKERDIIGNSDFIGVFINGYDDHQQSMEFILQASGVQFDARQTPDTGEDSNWNAVWNSAVKITQEGWTAEMRIPFSELRFPKKDIKEFGINFFRNIQRHQKKLTFSHVDNSKGNLGEYDALLTGIKNVDTPVRLSVLPYFSAYLNSYEKKSGFHVNGGMDVKYGINDAFTLDLTLIPDFGQANFDEIVLNLGPFEQQFNENRPFFTEGTELFNKGNLFYTRRVGGSPSRSPQLSINEVLLQNPEKVNLFNGLKISGRTSKGLGIGIFNGVTERAVASVINEKTGEIREVTVEPWANYNVLVLDQRIRRNSSVTFVNTNVVRDGDFRDANVSALLADIKDTKNNFNIFGHFKESMVRNRTTVFGTEGNLGSAKISGENLYGANVFFRTKEYNIDDLGFTGGSNIINYNSYYNYRYLKPRGPLNSLSYRVTAFYSNRLEPALFRDFSIHQNLELQNRKFQNFGMGLYVRPFGSRDIYEPRTPGRFLHVPTMVNPWIFYNSDRRKKLSYGGYTEIYVYDQSGRTTYITEWNTRYRFSDRFSLEHEFDNNIDKNNIGFAAKKGAEIFMGRRNIHTFENGITANYTFNEKMSLHLALRHYVSAVAYNKFYTLQQDGGLHDFAETMAEDGTFNFWNVDLRYSWWFAPGSQLTLLLRNATDSYLPQAYQRVDDNYRYLFAQPMHFNVSLKITYFLDYNKFRSWVKK